MVGKLEVIAAVPWESPYKPFPGVSRVLPAAASNDDAFCAAIRGPARKDKTNLGNLGATDAVYEYLELTEATPDAVVIRSLRLCSKGWAQLGKVYRGRAWMSAPGGVGVCVFGRGGVVWVV